MVLRIRQPTPPPSSLVDEVLQQGSLVPYFQPIVSVRQRVTIGAEALARVPLRDGRVLMPEWLFKSAAREGRLTAIERLCCETAIGAFAEIPGRRPDQILFLNLGAWPLHHALAPEDLARAVDASGLARRQIAVEILESRVESLEVLQAVTARLREAGFLVVLDDVGSGHSNLDRIPLLQPDIIKIDQSLVRGLDLDYHKQETVKCLVNLSRKIGALVVAEGLEIEEEALSALELGADLLQGYLLGRPAADGSIIVDRPDRMPSVLDSLTQTFKARRSAWITGRRERYRRFTELLQQVRQHLVGVHEDGIDRVLTREIARYAGVECVYVLDHTGTQVSETICHPHLPRHRSGVLFRPSPRGTDHSAKEYFYALTDVAPQTYVTDPYVSWASGSLSRTISGSFADEQSGQSRVLCIDVLAD